EPDLEQAEVEGGEVELELDHLLAAVGGQLAAALEQLEEAPLAGLLDGLAALAAEGRQRRALLLGRPAHARQLLAVALEDAVLAGDLELDAADLRVADEDDVEVDAQLLVDEHDHADVLGAVEELDDLGVEAGGARL